MLSGAPKLMKNIFTLMALYLTVFLVILPQNCLSAAKDAVDLCLNTIIPSLFPFFVCSGIISKSSFTPLCSRLLSPLMRPLFRLPGSGAITFLLGAVSGYPVGAASAIEQYQNGQCTITEAQHLTAFCNNSSPLFVIGVVGTGFLGNPSAGYILYASHILASIAVGLLFRFYNSPKTQSKALPASGQKTTKKAAFFSLGGIIDSSVFSTLKVCGFIIFFSVFTSAIPHSFLQPYICCLTEIAGGLRILSASPISGNLFLPLVSLFLGFSGISVILQVISIITPHGLSPIPFILGKFLQGILSFFITMILLHFIPLSQPVFNYENAEFISTFSPRDLILASILSVFFVIAVLKGIMHLSFLSDN